MSRPGPQPLLACALLCVALVAPSTPATARELATVGFDYVLDVPLTGVDPTHPDMKLALATVEATAQYPFVFESTGTVLVPGVRYRGTVPILSHGDEDFLDDFHELGVSLAVVQRIHGPWSALLRLNPSLATNLRDVDGEHVRFAGALVGFYTVSQRLRLGLGVALNYSFGELLPLPAVAVDWRPVDTLSLALFVPQRFRFAWRVHHVVELGVGARLVGNRYFVPNPANPDVESVTYTVVDVHGFVDLRLYGWLWLSLRCGHTVWRKFEVRDHSGSTLGGRHFDNAPVFGASLALRPELPDADPRAADP